MKILKSLFFSAASALPLHWLTQYAATDVLIPYQHLVSDKPVSYIENLYGFKNVQQFEADIDFYLRNFDPVSLTEIIAHRRSGRPFGKKRFLLTFDDGLRQVYDTVMPVLLRKGVPAALFINPAFVGNKELFYDIKKGLILHTLRKVPARPHLLQEIGRSVGKQIRSPGELSMFVTSIHYHNKHLADIIGNLLQIDFADFAGKQQPFMSTEQVKTWIHHGFHVGAHSIDHPLYSTVSLEEQIRQTRESVNWVCNTFDITYRTFAFPHVDQGVGHAFFTRLLQDDQLKLDLILGNRTARVESHAGVLHRFIGENPLLPAETMVKAVLSYNLLSNAFGQSIIKRGKL